jgi:hypothetical protein
MTGDTGVPCCCGGNCCGGYCCGNEDGKCVASCCEGYGCATDGELRGGDIGGLGMLVGCCCGNGCIGALEGVGGVYGL